MSSISRTGTAGPDTDGRQISPGRSGWAGWAAGFLLIFGLLAAWSLATPKYAAPDEPVQAFRAASLVRGEILGRDVSKPGDPSVQVTIPATLAAFSPSCINRRTAITAACLRTWTERPGMVHANTYTGRYPPLYYIAVGLPSLITTGGNMLLWMRLAGDLVNALFLTAGFALLARTSRPGWAVLGGAVAMTPMVLFIGSVVNPSGLEICSAFALWSALLAWIRPARGVPERGALIWSTVSAVVFESTRGLSPVFMAATVAAVAVVAGRPRIRQLISRRDTRVAGAVVAGFGVLAVVWIVLAGALRLAQNTLVPANWTTSTIVHAALFKNRQVLPFVGAFGWLDTPAPAWVVITWEVAAAGLVVALVVGRAWRSLIVVALLGLGTVLIPTVGDVLQARTIGMVAQSRYILPLAIGIALVAGTGIDLRGRWTRAVSVAGLAALAIAQIGAFLLALRRYRFGLGSAVPNPAVWAPPLGAAALITVFVAAALGLQVWLLTITWPAARRVRRPSPAA